MVLFLHNSYSTPEFPDYGNLEGIDLMEDLGWAMHFRETNVDPSVHFRKAYMDQSKHFRKANMECLILLYSQLYSHFHFQVYTCFYSQFESQLVKTY